MTIQYQSLGPRLHYGRPRLPKRLCKMRDSERWVYSVDVGWRREHAARVWSVFAALAWLLNAWVDGYERGGAGLSDADNLPGWHVQCSTEWKL